MAKSWLPRENSVPDVEVAAQTAPAGPSNADRQAELGLGDSALPSRAAVTADPSAYGVPEGCSPDDYFNEYVARLAQKGRDFLDEDKAQSPEQAAEIARHKELIRSWGYDPDAISYLDDNDTGLEAMRLDALDKEHGPGSIVAFNGTQFGWQGEEASFDNPLGGFNDVFTDMGREIGRNQYGPNQEAIRALIEGGSGDITLTGQSLGGALAAEAAADNADLITDMVGFQSPGVDRETAARFSSANADDHVDVRYHSSTDDIVHRAGESRLDGTFYDYDADEDLSVGDAHGTTFMYNDVGFSGNNTPYNSMGSRKTSISDTDPVGERLALEGGRQLLGGTLNTLGSPFQGLWAGVRGLRDAGSNALGGLSDAGSSLWGGLSGGLNTAWEGASGGVSDILHGDVLGGLGTLGGGLLSGGGQALGGLWDGALGLGQTGLGLAQDTGSALWDTLSTTGSQALDGLGTIGSGLDNLGRAGADWVGDKASDAADWVGDTASGAADWLTGGASKALGWLTG